MDAINALSPADRAVIDALLSDAIARYPEGEGGPEFRKVEIVTIVAKEIEARVAAGDPQAKRIRYAMAADGIAAFVDEEDEHGRPVRSSDDLAARIRSRRYGPPA